jgi:hypothetical protein
MNATLTLPTVSYSIYWDLAISFENYLKGFRDVLEREKQLPIEQRAELFPYYEINLQRLTRSAKTFQVREDVMENLLSLSKGYKVLVISEYWCGDAAQIVGQLAKISEMSGGKLDMKFVFRDEHPQLMDAHLTNGGKSIPKVIVLDMHDTPILSWGPRPAHAQQLLTQLKANPETASTYAEELHKWYARNQGEALQDEWIALIKSLASN